LKLFSWKGTGGLIHPDPSGFGIRDHATASKIVPRSQKKHELGSIQVARYALDSGVLPLVTDTLTVAEAARRTLMGIYGRLTQTNGVGGRSRIFSGKDDNDRPLTTHRHSYYLPTDEDGDGRLDHLTIFAADCFGPNERRALDLMRKLRTGRETEARHPLRLLLLGMGTPDEYAPGPLRAADVWVSATPYRATRYAKTRGRDRIDLHSTDACASFLTDDVRAQLNVVIPDLGGEWAGDVSIEPLWDSNHVFKIADRWRPIQFKRFRQKRDDDGGGGWRARLSWYLRSRCAVRFRWVTQDILAWACSCL
jgi:CRISPR-associated protein Csb2